MEFKNVIHRNMTGIIGICIKITFPNNSEQKSSVNKHQSWERNVACSDDKWNEVIL